MIHELFLAFRYLKPRKNAVSLITMTSILGVTLGVTVLMVVMAVMSGFTGQMKEKLIETQSHFQIYQRRVHIGELPKNNPLYPRTIINGELYTIGVDAFASKTEAAGKINDQMVPTRPLYEEEFQEIEKSLNSKNATCTKVIQSPVLIQYTAYNSAGQKIQKLDTQNMLFAASKEALQQHLHLDKHLKSGTLQLGNDFDTDAHYAVISTYMADRWGLKTGDKFLVHSAKNLTDLVKFNAEGSVELNDDSTAYLPAEFTVAGIYALGKSDFDQLVFFVGLDDAADLFFEPDKSGRYPCATAVYGWGQDPFDQQQLLRDISSDLPQVKVIGWEEANRNFLEVLEVEKLMMFFLLIFIVLVAAFSITNTLITSVYQKTREIGLLKALGCTDNSVMRIFVMQGFLVGLIGSVSGTVLGFLVIHFRQNILNFASMISGQELFPKKFYFFDQLPAQIILSDVAFIVISSILLCTIGALLPALRAARLQPSEALRYE